MDPNAMIPTAPAGTSNDPLDKYVRTYEGDQRTLAKGGKPDLKPYVSSPPHSPPPKPEPPPPPSAPEPATVGPREVQPVSTIPTLKMEMPVVGPPPIKKEVPVAPADPLETYTSDFIDRVRKTRASTATVLAAEQDARQGAPEPEAPPKKISPLTVVYGIAGTLFVIAGGVGLYSAYVRYTGTHAPITLTPTIPSPIAVDENRELSGSGATLMRAVADAALLPLAPGSIRLLSIATSTGSAGSASGSVFAALGTSAPGVLTRNVNAKGSMAGVMSVDGSESVFFILSVLSYKETFAGMLSWEAKMLNDLEPLFPRLAVGTSSPNASTSAAAFVDDTIMNHDVRIARTARGESVLLYGYWNQTTLIIARTPAVFTEILQRLSTQQAQR